MDQIIIGVDTQKSNHIAVAISTQSARLGGMTIPTTLQGYRDLEVWALRGRPVSRTVAKGHTILDVMRPNRQLRYLHGKSDDLDAERGTRSVLNRQAKAVAKTQAGSSEMIRHIKIARDSALKSKSQAMVTLKTLIINASAELRASLDQIRGPVTLAPEQAERNFYDSLNAVTLAAK